MLFLCNLMAFRRARADSEAMEIPAVSILIPARDEADRIGQTLQAVLASRGVELELIVLDDQSQDATFEIVSRIAAADQRVRLMHAPPLPRGWCGKQHACHVLAQHARHAELVFIDADVTLRPDAIRRCVLQRRACGADLLSGFPRQMVGSMGEALLIPLIYIVLLTYLPFVLMRKTRLAAASAGCGQLFVTHRQAYQSSGGHAAIKASLHDGVTLPRAYRRAGLRTDVIDADDIANCRMYEGWRQTCAGLLKNAHEGFANHFLILPFTVLLVLGYVAPTALALHHLMIPGNRRLLIASVGAAIVSYIPRLVVAMRYDRCWSSAAFFPLGVLILVVLQWIAWGRQLMGTRSHWRGRAYAAAVS
jgi:glycosyltransferase involved in cell wall biosynthesis